jgi:hypothetical protein
MALLASGDAVEPCSQGFGMLTDRGQGGGQTPEAGLNDVHDKGNEGHVPDVSP